MSKFRRTRVTQKKVFGAQFGTRTAFYQDYYNANENLLTSNTVGGQAFFSQKTDPTDPGQLINFLTMTQYHPLVYDLSHPFVRKEPLYRVARSEANADKQSNQGMSPCSNAYANVGEIRDVDWTYQGRRDFNFATDEPSALMAQRQMRKIYMKRAKIDIDIHGAGSLTTEQARTNPLHFMIVQGLTNQSGAEGGTVGGDLQTFIKGILGGMKTKAQNNFKLLNHKVFNQAMTTNHNTCKYQYSWKPVDWNRTSYNAADADPDDLVPVGKASYAKELKHRFLVVFFETGELILPDAGDASAGDIADGELRNNGFIEMKVTKTVKYTPATDVTMDEEDPYGISSLVRTLVQKQMKMTEETQV